jgi:hypothetical protein
LAKSLYHFERLSCGRDAYITDGSDSQEFLAMPVQGTRGAILVK